MVCKTVTLRSDHFKGQESRSLGSLHFQAFDRCFGACSVFLKHFKCLRQVQHTPKSGISAPGCKILGYVRFALKTGGK